MSVQTRVTHVYSFGTGHPFTTTVARPTIAGLNKATLNTLILPHGSSAPSRQTWGDGPKFLTNQMEELTTKAENAISTSAGKRGASFRGILNGDDNGTELRINPEDGSSSIILNTDDDTLHNSDADLVVSAAQGRFIYSAKYLKHDREADYRASFGKFDMAYTATTTDTAQIFSAIISARAQVPLESLQIFLAGTKVNTKILNFGTMPNDQQLPITAFYQNSPNWVKGLISYLLGVQPFVNGDSNQASLTFVDRFNLHGDSALKLKFADSPIKMAFIFNDRSTPRECSLEFVIESKQTKLDSSDAELAEPLILNAGMTGLLRAMGLPL